ncbi:hypothetical protein PCE1_002544 [Barthelona sp. PCE]
MGKPRGINAGRKLRNHRKIQRWADKRVKTALLRGASSGGPMGGASHALGTVLKKIGIGPKQPNSAVRKCVRVQLNKNDKIILAYVPWDGSLGYILDKNKVLISGMGRSGRCVGDLPGVRFKVVKVGAQSLIALWRGRDKNA